MKFSVRFVDIIVLVSFSLVLSSCGLFVPDVGSAGQACFDDGTCKSGNECINGVCVVVSDGDYTENSDSDKDTTTPEDGDKDTQSDNDIPDIDMEKDVVVPVDGDQNTEKDTTETSDNVEQEDDSVDDDVLPNDGDYVEPDGDDEEPEEEEEAPSKYCFEDQYCNENFGPTYSCHNNLYRCIEQECAGIEDCKKKYGDNFECNLDDGLCYLKKCDTNGDCSTGQICEAGVCINEQCVEVKSIRITPESGVIKEGETVDITATLLDEDGKKVRISDETMIVWHSENTDQVKTTANGAVATLTGQSVTGQAKIKVSLKDQGSCGAALNDAAVANFQNYTVMPTGTTDPDVRVVVFDHESGLPIPGANVFFGKKITMKGPIITDASGVATIKMVADTCNLSDCLLHVFHLDYSYVSIFNITTGDFAIPLKKNRNLKMAQGAKGQMDKSKIPEVFKQDKDVWFGLAGMAYKDDLSEYTPGNLGNRGDFIQVNFGTFGDKPTPTGVEMSLSGTELKEFFEAQGAKGASTLWGFGAWLTLSEVLSAINGNGGSITVQSYLAAFIPMFQQAYHGTTTGITLTELAKVKDVDDVNKNQKTDDLVPDFANFQNSELEISRPQNKEFKTLYTNELPDYNMSRAAPNCMDFLFSVTGVMQTGIGFVPLGFGFATDQMDESDTKDCKLYDKSITTQYAAPYSGLSGYDYVTLYTAMPEDMPVMAGEDGTKEEIAYSTVVDKYCHKTGSPCAIDSFVPLDEDFSISKISDTISITSTANPAGQNGTYIFSRAILSEVTEDSQENKLTNKLWYIYWKTEANKPSVSFDFDFPQNIDFRPSTGDINARYIVQRIAIYTTPMGVTNPDEAYEQLFKFNSHNLNNMDDLLIGYSMYGKNPPLYGEGCGCYSAKATPAGVIIIMMLVLLGVLRRKVRS